MLIDQMLERRKQLARKHWEATVDRRLSIRSKEVQEIEKESKKLTDQICRYYHKLNFGE